jgi:hypothetical protein
MAPSTNDYAYAEASSVLTGPAVVPVELGQQGVVPQLILTAPAAAASVEVQAYDTAMAPLASSTVEIAAGTTELAGLDTAGAAYVVLRPTGDVIAAATYVKADGISSLAVTDAPVTVAAPQVRPVG